VWGGQYPAKTHLRLTDPRVRTEENLCPIQQCETWLARIATSRYSYSRGMQTTFQQLSITDIGTRDRTEARVTHSSPQWSSAMVALSQSKQIIRSEPKKHTWFSYERE
jgi:hypothetical protein